MEPKIFWGIKRCQGLIKENLMVNKMHISFVLVLILMGDWCSGD